MGEINLNINEENCFETLSVWKLFAMSVCTFGLYEFLWFYRTWRIVQKQINYDISPFWRTFFYNITVFNLFPKLNTYIVKHSDKEKFAPILLALTYFILGALYKLPDPYWMICLLSVTVLMFLQDKINKINKNFYPNAIQNKWSGKNTIVLIIGFIWLALAIVGMSLKDEPNAKNLPSTNTKKIIK